jgi:hypothetical protein
MENGLYGHPALSHLPPPAKSRYMLEVDEQLLGYDAIFRMTDEDRIPPLNQTPALPYVYCAACETTWLVGLEGEESAKNHPYHNTLFQRDSGQSRRSMVVRVKGTCSNDNAPSDKSSVEIFFGPGSSYNIISNLNTLSPTEQTAEILAATHAMCQVRKKVRSKREEIVRAKEGIYLEDRWSIGWSTPRLERHRNNWIFRLIVITESTYLVECLWRHRQGWQLKPDSLYRDSQGAPLLHGALFVDLLKEIDLLSRDGVEVM